MSRPEFSPQIFSTLPPGQRSGAVLEALTYPARFLGSRFDGELARFLHRRLVLVTVLSIVPGLLFLLRDLVEPPQPPFSFLGVWLRFVLVLFQGCVLATLLGVSDWTLSRLRYVELSLVASMTGLFAWLQLGMYRHPVLFEIADCDYGLEIVRMWIHSTAVRWFFLIVVYGVFIPNTWVRCLLVTGSVSSLALAITMGGALTTNHLCFDVLYGTFDLAVFLGTAMAVASFGSHRLRLLQQQAFQARQLGQYRLGRKLGAGGMGEVYQAEHVLLRRRCAIKLIRPDQTHDPAILERFEREVQAMAGLTHPNTVEVYDYGRSDDGTFYYVMEYLPGLTLEELVTGYGPVPPGRAIFLLAQLCRALREAHGIGLLHRDIKPSNVIVGERGGESDVAKLLDFGLVQSVVPGDDGLRLTTQGMILGSPPFMSPEQAVGKSDLGPTTDVYSLGGVGYYLVTGRPPFVRETPMEVLLAHAYEPVEPPAGVPDDLSAVILRCLSKKPGERFCDVKALELALQQCESAGDWDEERAAAWWRALRPAIKTPAVPTDETQTVATSG